MTKPVEFFFDFISPFGWFAAERIGTIARSHGRTVSWRPILLGVTVKQAMGLPPILETPVLRTPLAAAYAHNLFLRCGRARGRLGRGAERP
jgi:2-hydroxychromene-2-carboxylate isomerase